MNKLINGVILSCDIRNFTSYTYNVGSENSMNRINYFLEKLIDNIITNKGEILNLTGDGFIASFTEENRYKDCIKSILDLRRLVKELNKEYHSKNESVINIGIGISDGEFVKKNFNIKDQNFNLSIGHAINLASKIESHTKKNDG